MSTTTITIVIHEEGRQFDVAVEPLPEGGWRLVEKGFWDVRPGRPGTKVTVDGEVFWAQRQYDHLILLSD